ncbi:MAG: hypothetical protein IKE74_07475 [Mogibacterium sp.]|nr:hypothetical protein [Mogibacterium sp.]
MDQKIFIEAQGLYGSTDRLPNVIRVGIRLKNSIDPGILRYAVDRCAERYPYFCVQIEKKDGEWVLAANERPVPVTASREGVRLGSDDAGRHLMAFSYNDCWINFDISHAVTDGIGAYEVVRTLLYYYCSRRNGTELSAEGIRICGDEISPAEWEDPLLGLTDVEARDPAGMGPALCLTEESGIGISDHHWAWDIAIDEKEFMRFNLENDGSPGTMTALFLSRAIERLHPDAGDGLRVLLAVNMRRALRAPLAHQPLVGGAALTYKPVMRGWPLEKQATAYRGMVLVQTREEHVLAEAAGQRAMAGMILSLGTDPERRGVAENAASMTDSIITAGVSYVGRGNFGDAEKYVRDFRLYTNSISRTPLIEISAVNGRFILSFIQPFRDDRYIRSFLEELDDNYISYSLMDAGRVWLPGVELPF